MMHCNEISKTLGGVSTRPVEATCLAAEQGLNEQDVRDRLRHTVRIACARFPRKTHGEFSSINSRGSLSCSWRGPPCCHSPSARSWRVPQLWRSLVLNGAIGFVTERRRFARWKRSPVERRPRHRPPRWPSPESISHGACAGRYCRRGRRQPRGSRSPPAKCVSAFGRRIAAYRRIDPGRKECRAALARCAACGSKQHVVQGTAVTRGSGDGVVIATGMETELGRISSLVAEAKETKTPLEVQLDRLGQWLVWATLAITAVVAMVGIVAGKDPLLMVADGDRARSRRHPRRAADRGNGGAGPRDVADGQT